MATAPRILTNMAFWQSEAWRTSTDSLYDLGARRDPVFLPWWREAFALFRRRAAYDAVVTMGVRESMLYGLLCALTGRPSRQVMCEVFIDTPRPGNAAWLLKTWLYGIVARRSLGVLTNSSAEIETMARRYRLPPARLRYVPLNTNIADPQRVPDDDGFVLSAGRTLRDYATLAAAAPLIAAPIIVVCGRADTVADPLPANLTVLRELPREAYLDHLRRARVVALPLLPTDRATGQVVMLEAMGYGKPVVTTRSPGTVDYIQDGINGLLLAPGDADGLASAVNGLLENPERRQALGNAAVAAVRELASAERHARLKLDAIAELARPGNPA